MILKILDISDMKIFRLDETGEDLGTVRKGFSVTRIRVEGLFKLLQGHAEEALGGERVLVHAELTLNLKEVALGVGNDVHVLYPGIDRFEVGIVKRFRPPRQPVIRILVEVLIQAGGKLEPAHLLDADKDKVLAVNVISGELGEHGLQGKLGTAFLLGQATQVLIQELAFQVGGPVRLGRVVLSEDEVQVVNHEAAIRFVYGELESLYLLA
mmetsp:Transcript_22800/g.64084  ORF Transcript_22800/g.64084 Transcript_22800/m.64084 type:complete len:211 (-) Transcript_22800:1207-1839(-)